MESVVQCSLLARVHVPHCPQLCNRRRAWAYPRAPMICPWKVLAFQRDRGERTTWTHPDSSTKDISGAPVLPEDLGDGCASFFVWWWSERNGMSSTDASSDPNYHRHMHKQRHVFFLPSAWISSPAEQFAELRHQQLTPQQIHLVVSLSTACLPHSQEHHATLSHTCSSKPLTWRVASPFRAFRVQ